MCERIDRREISLVLKKAVIAVAGVGSRMLPLAKALPKEMLPVVDQPVIELTVRELVASGLTDITIVISSRKQLIQQHFAPDADLEKQLIADGKESLAGKLRDISNLAHIKYVYQNGPYGNGTAVLNAMEGTPDEPYLVLWGDDVFIGDVPRAQQLVSAYEATQCPVIALMPIAPADAPKYGVPVVAEDLGGGVLRISGLIEKPSPDETPSHYAAIGGYVCTPAVTRHLEEVSKRWHDNPAGEVYLTHAFHTLAAEGLVYGRVIDGEWWDTGTPINYLKAQFAFALSHPQYGPELRNFIKGIDM